jgi:hypothetical protein
VVEGQKIIRVAPLASAQFPNWTPAGPAFLAEEISESFRGELRGRRIIRDDLRVEVMAVIGQAGRAYQTKLVGEPSGIWYRAVPPETQPAAVRSPPFADAVAHQPVWVLGAEIEKAVMQGAGPGQRLTLSSPCLDGGVVFDQEGRVVALCLPGPEAGAAATVPARRGLDLLSGVKDGISK